MALQHALNTSLDDLKVFDFEFLIFLFIHLINLNEELRRAIQLTLTVTLFKSFMLLTIYSIVPM